MPEKETGELTEDTVVSTRKKSIPKVPTNDMETPIASKEKKRKAPKITTETEHPDESKTITPDQEVPAAKPKKKRAPKIGTNDENNGSIEEPIKKKKSKAPKPSSIDDDFQMIESPAIDELEPQAELKVKTKKPKKPKAPIRTASDSFEDLQVTNLDEVYSPSTEINEFTDDAVPETSLEAVAPSENDISEHEKAITDAFNSLGSQVNFSQYFEGDQWSIIHLPKSARPDPKSRIRKMLPGGSKDEKSNGKTPVQKANLFNRIFTTVNTLVRDENNFIFGEPSNYDVGYFDEEADGVDTDDLHRYAQRLRELEDKDRELNPEFLVLRDGKTVFGVHESDHDGKTKLATRKPIYDRFADQKPDQQSERKKLLLRFKSTFTRSKDKDGKGGKSDSTTPEPRNSRKSGTKSLDEGLTTTATDDPPMT